MFGLNWITIAVIASLGILVGVQEMRVQSLKTEQAEYVADVEKATRIATEAALAEQTRRQQAYDDEAQHARDEIKQLEGTVSQLADLGDGLRSELASAVQRAKQNPKPAVGGKGQPSADPIDMFAQLLARADREAGVLAEYSDRLKLAGLACERASDGAR